MRLPGVPRPSSWPDPTRASASGCARSCGCDEGVPLPALAEVRDALERAGLARQKWPEELHLGDDLPRTPSGKVQKALLRQRLRDAAPA